MRNRGDNLGEIFITGVGRSGTSLIQSMLAAHPDITFLPETAFIRRLIATGKLAAVIDSKGKEGVRLFLENDQLFQRTELRAGEIVEQAFDKGDGTAGNVYQAMMMVARRRQGNFLVGDKDPRSIEWLPLVKALLPECHVIHIIRDPRDVLASKKKASWSRGRKVLFQLFAGRVQLKLGRSLGYPLFGERYHEVVYEELLAWPEKTLNRLCLDLGISFSPEMLEFGVAARSLISESELSWKKETLGPLLKDNINKWRHQLNDVEVSLTEIICKEAFNVYSYEHSGKVQSLSFQKKVYVYSMWLFVAVLDPVYRSYRTLCVRRYL